MHVAMGVACHVRLFMLAGMTARRGLQEVGALVRQGV